MSTTFVTLSRACTESDTGFWIQDGMLGVWLRLLALHLPEPEEGGKHQATIAIRNQWLLASRFRFGGCTPHEMEDACSTQAGRDVVRYAIDSLLTTLRLASTPLDAHTLDLLGIEGTQFASIERRWLQDIGYAFLDLIDGRITGTASSTEVMPGSKPYVRKSVQSV